MEIMRDGKDRRTVIAVLGKGGDGGDFGGLLGQDFNLISVNSTDECLDVMYRRKTGVSAIIVDVDLAKANDYGFLRAVNSEVLFDTIPILIASLRDPDESDARCLEEGAIDFMMKPYQRDVVKQRIENAIRLKDSRTFYEIETMLKELPSNIFLKDAEGRYIFATHYWHHLKTAGDPNWSIRGKTDLEIRKDYDNAVKAYESDKEIIRTGVGTSYVIEINADGIREFLELIKRPVFDAEGNAVGVIALANDVTETELLKRELEERARTDELTRLNNRRSFDEVLQGLSQRSDYPLAVISADCDELKRVNDTFGHLVGDEYIRMAATAFESALPESAQAFRTGGDEFVAFVPNTTAKAAQEIANAMQSHAELFKLTEHDVSISCGVSVIEGPDDNPLAAIASADHAMYANKAARKRARLD